MTQAEFFQFMTEDIPQQLFHVSEDDIDDETGAHLQDIILLNALSANPGALKFHTLAWFVDNFLTVK